MTKQKVFYIKYFRIDENGNVVTHGLKWEPNDEFDPNATAQDVINHVLVNSATVIFPEYITKKEFDDDFVEVE